MGGKLRTAQIGRTEGPPADLLGDSLQNQPDDAAVHSR